jgi:acyl carrier protein
MRVQTAFPGSFATTTIGKSTGSVNVETAFRSPQQDLRDGPTGRGRSGKGGGRRYNTGCLKLGSGIKFSFQGHSPRTRLERLEKPGFSKKAGLRGTAAAAAVAFLQEPEFGVTPVTQTEAWGQIESTIADKVVAVLADRLGKPPSSIRLDDDLLLDLGIDSLSMAEVTVLAEQAVGSRIPASELIDACTVGDLVRVLASHSRRGAS